MLEREIARRLKKKIPVSEMRDIRGTAFLAHDASECEFDSVTLPSFADVCDSKRFYADATRIEYAEHDPVRSPGTSRPRRTTIPASLHRSSRRRRAPPPGYGTATS